MIQARGAVGSGGWRAARLRPLKAGPADAHTIVVEFVAIPPAPEPGRDRRPAAHRRQCHPADAAGSILGSGGIGLQRNHHADSEIASPMQIDFISDTVCPWCFIGKRRLARAMALRPDILFNVRYRPYRLDPTVPRAGLDRAAYMAARFGADGKTGTKPIGPLPPKAPRKTSLSIGKQSASGPIRWIPTA